MNQDPHPTDGVQPAGDAGGAPADPQAPASAPPTRRAKFADALKHPVALVAVAAFVLLALQWYEARTGMASLQQELARRIAESDAYNKESRHLARQAQEVIKDVELKLVMLETRLAESQSQQVALEALYQELSRSRDEWALAEIEQMLTIASQQLQLAGNVQAALTALNAADNRLSRSDRAQFIPLRKLLAKDIERLKSLPFADITGISLKLDNLIAAVDTLPLAFDERQQGAPRAPPGRAAAPPEGFWARIGADLWSELRQLVRVSRIDQPDPVLLSPGQAFFLRENLKLRLLNARFGLLQRDEQNFREDMRVAQAWIARYFDTRAKTVQNAQAQLRSFAGTALAIELPSLTSSIDAVRNYKLAREKPAR
jgi:uroporphyrin-3 C-methyltransferase